MRIALAQGFAQRAVLFAQIADIQLFVDHHPHLGQGKRFQNVIAGARLHGVDRGFNTAKRSHHDDGQSRVLALDGLQKFQTVHAGEFQIGQDEIDGIFAQQLEAGFGVFGGERGKSVVAEIQLEQPAHLGLVFDNQNCRHGRIFLDSASLTRSPDEQFLPLRSCRSRRGKISRNGRRDLLRPSLIHPGLLLRRRRDRQGFRCESYRDVRQ